jgi:hypothetical protein
MFKRILYKDYYIISIKRMLFRDINGNLVEINKYDFKNDKAYYQKIMEIKEVFTKSNKSGYSTYIINNALKETANYKNK